MEKHGKQKGSDEERTQGEGPEIVAVPGEKAKGLETLRDRRDGGA